LTSLAYKTGLLRFLRLCCYSAADCPIVCFAIEHGSTLLHDDGDFENMARVILELSLAWVRRELDKALEMLGAARLLCPVYTDF